MPNIFTPTAPNLYAADQQRTDLTYDELFAPGQVARGLRSSAFSTDAGTAASDYWQARAAGDIPRARANGLRAQQLAEEAARSAPRVQSVGDIHSGGDFADWGMGALGATPVSMVKPLVGGLAGAAAGSYLGPVGATLGGMAGAATGMQGDMRDAARLQQMQAEQQGARALAPQQVLDDTNQQGWVQAGIESLVPGMVGKSFVSRSLKPHGFLRTLGADVALDSGAAAVSEGAAMGYETGRNPNRDTSGDMMRYADAAAGEAVAGVGYGALHHTGNVVQGALGGSLDAAGTAADYAARVGKQGAQAAGAAAKEAWANRPKTLDEAALMAGEGAAKLHTKAEDLVTRIVQHGKDPDVDTLLRPQTGMDEKAMRGDDDAKHAAARSLISKLAQSPDEVPDYVRKAAEEYSQGSRLMDSWSPLKDAVNDWKRGQNVMSGVKEMLNEKVALAGEAAGKVHNAIDDAVDTYKVKRSVDGRANAQTPQHSMMVEGGRDDFSPLLDEELKPLVNFKTLGAAEEYMPFVTHGMREWITNGFAIQRGGKVTVPDGLFKMFTDPLPAVKATVQLMHRQGLIDDAALEKAQEVTQQLDVKQTARMDAGRIVGDNLVPTALAGRTFSQEGNAQRAAYYQEKLRTTDLSAAAQGPAPSNAVGAALHAAGVSKPAVRANALLAEATAEFGPRARTVLEALRANDAAAQAKMVNQSRDVSNGRERTVSGLSDENGAMKDNAGDTVAAGLDAEGMAQLSSSHLDKEAGKPTVTFHHYRDGSTDKTTGEIKPPAPFKLNGRVKNKADKTGAPVADTLHNVVAAKRTTDLQAVSAADVKKVGYIDYLREKHGADVDSLMRDAEAVMEAHKDELIRLQNKTGRQVTMADGSKQIVHDSLDKLLNKHYYVLREEAQRKQGEATNVSADEFKHVGYRTKDNKWGERDDGEFGTVKHGRIWLERNNADGTKTEFATSTGRIIDRLSKARKAEGNVDDSGGLSGQHTVLMQGLASLMTTEGTDGKPVLSGRIGVKETADGPIKWLEKGDKLPDSLRMHSTDATYKDAKDAVQAKRNDATLAEANKLLNGSMNPKKRKALLAAIKAKDYKTLDDFVRVRDEIREGEQSEEETRTTHEHTYVGPFATMEDAHDALTDKGDKVVERKDGGWYIQHTTATQLSTGELGADVHETRQATRVETIARDNQGNKFGSKKIALQSAKEGDRVVKSGGKWVIERDTPTEVRARTGLPTEIGEMGKTSNVRSRQEDGLDNKVRTHDELSSTVVGEELGTAADTAHKWKRAEGPNPSFTSRVLDALRKGVPVFNKMYAGLETKAQRDEMVAQLQKMLAATSPSNAIWAGKPPADMAAFAKRAQMALDMVNAPQAPKTTNVAAKPPVVDTKPPAQKFGDVADKMHGYLDNPPADFHVKQVEAIRDWATKQEARLNEAKAKHEEGSDEWERLDDLRVHATMLKLKAEKAIKNEAEVEAHHADQGGPRYNAMATRIHTDLERGGFAATHDSPIRHEGKFDWRAHIGKGEGNAAFGAGTYLSTSDGVHFNYKRRFSGDMFRAHERRMREIKLLMGRTEYAEEAARLLYVKGKSAAMEYLRQIRSDVASDAKWVAKLDEHIAALNSLSNTEVAAFRAYDWVNGEKSPTYEVSVDIAPDQLMDWDAPLSEQSHTVQVALESAGFKDNSVEIAKAQARLDKADKLLKAMAQDDPVEAEARSPGAYEKALDERRQALFDRDWLADNDLSGKDMYRRLTKKLGSQAKASDYLQSLGILGHRYAAAGGKNDTHPNYVIYDDSKITTNYVHFNKQDPAHGAFGTAQAPSKEEQAAFHADILRRLGPQMKSGLLEALMGTNAKGKDIYLSGKWEKGAIYASVYARNLGQIGAHESFHEFFSRMKGEPAAAEVMKLLDRAANSPYVKRQLERLLDGEKEALAQIKDGAKHAAEERMAYMFQFHQAGLLTVGPETEGVFTKLARFFRKVAGLINDDERADLLLRAFDRGDMQTADAAARVLANSVTARAQLYSSVNNALVPVMDKLSRAVNTAETNLERTGIKEYHDVRRLFKRSVGESGAQGYLDAKDHMMKQWSNKLANVFEGKDVKDLELAAKYLHSGERPTDPVVKDLLIKLQSKDGLLPQMHKYLTDAGVQRWEAHPSGKGGKWVPMGKIDHKYFPRVYDTAMIVGNPDEFVSDFSKHNAAELNNMAAEHNALLAFGGNTDFTPVTAEDMARAIMNRLINGFGSEIDETNTSLQVGEGGKAALNENKGSIGFSPLMQAVNKRTLHWMSPEMLKKYGEKDIAKVLTAYVAQGVKRAEYVRRFGNSGEKLKALLTTAHTKNLDRLAEKEFGPNAKDIYSTTHAETKIDQRRVIEAALTTAGKQNVKERLDALEIKALKTAKSAATDVMAMEGTLGYNISPKLRKFENSLLVYENMRLLSTSLFSQFIDPLGIVVRGGTMTDAWNSYKRGIREVVASIKGDPIKDLDSQIADQIGTTDANGMLAAFGQLYSSQYMGATFRKANDVLFKYNGMEGFNRGMQVSATRAAINFIKRHVEQPNERSKDYLGELNLKAKDVVIDPKTGELDYTNPKIQQAVHQWVNGSVMRPNAAQRPAWGSDPHYMVFWHMKQFAYTFHDVIMKRAMHDYKKYGDMGPAGVLIAAYTPVMIATDALKGVLLTGDEPAWMKGGLDSELSHGAMRAGLMGKFQPGVDVLGPHRTVLGLGGPAVEQLAQLFDKSPVDSAINALPGANVWNTIKGGAMVEMQGED